MRLDPDWLAPRFGARGGLVSASGHSGLFCAGSCSALVPVIVAAGRHGDERDRQQHREGGLDLDHRLNLSALPPCGQTEPTTAARVRFRACDQAARPSPDGELSARGAAAIHAQGQTSGLGEWLAHPWEGALCWLVGSAPALVHRGTSDLLL